MILTVLTMGATVLGAATIAGLLMLYQLRQAGDVENSGRALYAAEAGIELGLYRVVQGASSTLHATPTVPFANTATFTMTCYEADALCSPLNEIDCTQTASSTQNLLIKSIGSMGNSSRGFDHCSIAL